MLRQETFRSKVLNNSRTIGIYTPATSRMNITSNRLLIIFDGQDFTNIIPLPIILDNLLAEGKILPTIAALVGNAIGSRARELSGSVPFTAFLSDELIPWLHERVAVTNKPTETVIVGLSLGGLAATFAAMNRPDLFGNVLSLSGSFWWKKDEAYEWMIRQLAAQRTLPIRFYIAAGLGEDRVMSVGEPTLLAANRHLRAILTQKQYPIRYDEFDGGHEYINWQGMVAEGLLSLLR
jgi:enterochelin esterase-like enzyme